MGAPVVRPEYLGRIFAAWHRPTRHQQTQPEVLSVCVVCNYQAASLSLPLCNYHAAFAACCLTRCGSLVGCGSETVNYGVYI